MTGLDGSLGIVISMVSKEDVIFSHESFLKINSRSEHHCKNAFPAPIILCLLYEWGGSVIWKYEEVGFEECGEIVK